MSTTAPTASATTGATTVGSARDRRPTSAARTPRPGAVRADSATAAPPTARRPAPAGTPVLRRPSTARGAPWTAWEALRGPRRWADDKAPFLSHREILMPISCNTAVEYGEFKDATWTCIGDWEPHPHRLSWQGGVATTHPVRAEHVPRRHDRYRGVMCPRSDYGSRAGVGGRKPLSEAVRRPVSTAALTCPGSARRTRSAPPGSGTATARRRPIRHGHALPCVGRVRSASNMRLTSDEAHLRGRK